jgi:hypothetical protein
MADEKKNEAPSERLRNFRRKMKEHQAKRAAWKPRLESK